jgi:CBS domain containing-hemolysin-like protein
MKNTRVKNIMIPLSEYATVPEDVCLHEAILALHDAQSAFKKNKYRHKAILVYDFSRKLVVGKISALDILKALEPKYRQIGNDDSIKKIGLSRFGLSPDFLQSAMVHYNLWDEPLEFLIAKAKSLIVKDFMYKPSDGEFVDEEAALSEAIHQLIVGQHQSLIVTSKKNNNEMIGILRLSDVFIEVCDLIVSEK